MDLIVKNLLSEAVGVPEGIIESAEELYEIVVNLLKDMDDYDTTQTFTEDGLDLTISDYKIHELELKIQIHEMDDYDGPIEIISAGVSNQFKFDRKILMKVHREDNIIELSVDFASNGDNWDSQEIYDCFTKDKVDTISVIAHEIKHKFDKQKKTTDLIGKDADYQAYASQRLNLGIPVINEFIRYSYFIQYAENLVRPTELATRMKLTGITREKFREFFENDKVVKELKQIRDFSYSNLIEKLYEQMDRIDVLLEHVGAPYEDMSEEEKIKEIMGLVYINLISIKRDVFDNMTEDTNGLVVALKRMLGFGGMTSPKEDEDEEERFQKVRHKYLSHLAKYQKREDQFFVDECERFNYVATKLIKRLGKIYSLISDEKEQTNESIINQPSKKDINEAVRTKKFKTYKTPEDVIKTINLVTKFTTPDIKKFLKNENINIELKDVKTKTFKLKDVFNHEAVIDITDKNGKSLKLSRSKKIDILELFHEYLILTGEGQNFPGGPYYHWDFVDSVDNYDDDESLKESIINWELHQKMMEKKYGKTKIKTKFDF